MQNKIDNIPLLGQSKILNALSDWLAEDLEKTLNQTNQIKDICIKDVKYLIKDLKK